MSALPRILTSQEVDRFLSVYELEADLPTWEREAVRQGLDMARDALAEADPDPGVAPEARIAVHRLAAGHCDYCAEQVRLRNYGATRQRNHRELDHMLSRYGL